MTRLQRLYVLAFWLSGVCISCQQHWLDAKPSKSLAEAGTLEDLQAILDNNTTLNKLPGLAELSADNYYVRDATWTNATSTLQRNCYIWADDIYGADVANPDWTNAYARILLLNIVLEKVDKLEKANGVSQRSGEIRSGALFLRGLNVFHLAQLFCMPYGSAGYDEFGLPLRLNSNVNEISTRATVAETYDRIILDLETAVGGLPSGTAYRTRPSRCAAYGLLSRVYLSMGNFKNVVPYADSCIALSDGLLDYRTLDASARYPIPPMNKEVLFYADLAIYTFNYNTALNVDTLLWSSYRMADTRKSLFFQTAADDVKFRGSYTGAATLFGGISTGEIYLNRAEARLRQHDLDGARADMQYFVLNRYTDGISIADFGEEELLRFILDERRKELVFRGIRWTDIRRLNQDPDQQKIILTRFINGERFELLPNTPRYMLPLPPNELIMGSMKQNPR